MHELQGFHEVHEGGMREGWGCERANERWWLCGPCETLMVRFERPGVGAILARQP